LRLRLVPVLAREFPDVQTVEPVDGRFSEKLV
jgi:hypothetical protein